MTEDRPHACSAPRPLTSARCRRPDPRRLARAVRDTAPFFGAGTEPNVLARLLAERLGATWGQPVVAEYVPGASAPNQCGPRREGTAGWLCTIVLTGGGAMVVRGSMDQPLPYDPHRNLAPISLLVRTRNLLVVHAAEADRARLRAARTAVPWTRFADVAVP